LQLAPDGKIYITENTYSDTAQFIGVISNPNEPSFACDFDPFALAIPVTANVFGIPAVNKSMYAAGYHRPSFTADFGTEIINTYSVQFNNYSVNADSVYWDFGDGFSSSEFSPVHFYLDTGQYQIVMKCFNQYGCSLTVQKIMNITDFLISTINPDQHSLRFYPNPASSLLNIDSNEPILEHRIVSLTGKIMYTVRDKVNNHFQIDISNFPIQPYFLSVRTSSHFYHEKVHKTLNLLRRLFMVLLRPQSNPC
jgi:PKD repeat protein